MTDLDEYVQSLVSLAPDVREIWLFGSRANATERPDSDWDLLVFGLPKAFSQLEGAKELHRPDVDCLVLIDADRIQSA